MLLRRVHAEQTRREAAQPPPWIAPRLVAIASTPERIDTSPIWSWRETVDHLTGVLRRGGGIEVLRGEVQHPRRSGEPLTVAFIDVYDLKAVNDHGGHLAGDALLTAVAGCVTRALRPYDGIMRYGGEEFVCALSGQTPAGLGERVTHVARELADRHDGTTISVGFAAAGPDECPKQVIAKADAAMIAERRRGR